MQQAGLRDEKALAETLASAIDERNDWVAAIPFEPTFGAVRGLPSLQPLLAQIHPRTRAR